VSEAKLTDLADLSSVDNWSRWRRNHTWKDSGTIEATDDARARLDEMCRYFGRHCDLGRVQVRGAWFANDVIYEVTGDQVQLE